MFNKIHKLFWVDIALVGLTFLGCAYLYLINQVNLPYAIIIATIYLVSKCIGYIILPYKKFDIFINDLIYHSKVGRISGFEIFKTTLVSLLFIGFIFIDPAIWIIESILVVTMRVWGYYFTRRKL